MITRHFKSLKDKSFFLFGPRQTGKTTLLRELYSKETTIFYDLLKSEEYTRLSAYPSLFREEVSSRGKNITHVIVDEIQRAPALLDEIHVLTGSPNPPIFIMTGSSARKLKRTKANLLAGRAFTYNLFPLTCSELGSEFSLQKALLLGTLPSAYLEDSPEAANERLRAYVDTYLKEEIELEAQVRGIGQFIRFLTIAGFENGNILNFSNMARDTGTSYHTVQSYFQILEDTLIGQFLYPYLKSQRKRSATHPKFYFFDTGIVRALTKRLTVPIEPRTPEFGKSFEHFVILEVMRHANYNRMDLSFSFYRTEGGAEVDLIIEAPNGNILAMEIKSTDNISSIHLRGLLSFAETCPSAKLCCVCTAPNRRICENVTILPWQEMYAWIEEFLVNH